MWKNDYENRLYVVKRKYVEEYHCGSYSIATPKLYKIGNAKSACKGLNKYRSDRDEPLTFAEWQDDHTVMAGHPRAAEYYQYYLEDFAKGPWVVAEVQFTASEIEYE